MSGLGKGLGALISQEGMSSVTRSNPKKEIDRKRKEIEDIDVDIEKKKKEVDDLRKDLTIQLMLEGKVDKTKLFEMEEELKFCFDRKEKLEVEIEKLIEGSPDKNTGDDQGKEDEGESSPGKTALSDEIDMRMVKDLMFGGDEKPVSDMGKKVSPPPEEETDEDHIEDLIHELDQSRQAEAVRKEAYGIDTPSNTQMPDIDPGDDTDDWEEGQSPEIDEISPSPIIRRTGPGKVRIVKKLKKTPSKQKDKGLYLYIRTAEKHLSTRDPDGAKRILHKALREYPLDDELLYHLGNAFFLEGDLDQAEIRFRKSTASNPKSYRAYNNLGVVLRKKGERESAIQAFNQALELNENYERAWLNLGTIFMEIEPPLLKEASIFLRRALECDPDLVQARQKLEECESALSTDS
jgi:TolA-binding protein